MIKVLENYPLQKHNTFHVNVKSRYFFGFSKIKELQEFFRDDKYKKLSRFIIGGGSNVLFCNDYPGVVIKAESKEIDLIHETEDTVFIKAAAGVDWDNFVSYCVEHSYFGAENLSFIPGTVGAAPVQNIGAYGAEVKDIIDTVIAYEIATDKIVEFTNEECQFAYRNSVFKNELKGKYIILHVLFKLKKCADLNTEYGAIARELETAGKLTIGSLRKAIIRIREEKLPDPSQIGNCGSFFKNPIVPKTKADSLKAEFPNIVTFDIDEGNVKIAAAWMIDSCGWKGQRIGDVGVHPHQALVIVNYGKSTGQEIVQFAEKIKTSVYNKFGVELDSEVNYVY